jgi:hypothetical protein
MRHKLQRAGVVEAIAGGVRRGLTVEAACALAGVHRSTLHRWRKADAMSDESGELERVQVAVAEAQAANQNELVEAAHRLALDGDGGMIRFLLERRHGWRPDASPGAGASPGDGGTFGPVAEPVRYRITIPVTERLGDAPYAYHVSEGGVERLLTPAEAFAEDAGLAEGGA